MIGLDRITRNNPDPAGWARAVFQRVGPAPGTARLQTAIENLCLRGDALDMESHRFRIIYNTIRPHQALADRTPKHPYLHSTSPPENLPTY